MACLRFNGGKFSSAVLGGLTPEATKVHWLKECFAGRRKKIQRKRDQVCMRLVQDFVRLSFSLNRKFYAG